MTDREKAARALQLAKSSLDESAAIDRVLDAMKWARRNERVQCVRVVDLAAKTIRSFGVDDE